MRLRLATVAAVAALGGAFAAAPGQARPVAAVCHAGSVAAHLSWGNRCLHAGEFCKVGNKEYRRYGFVCPGPDTCEETE